MDFVNRSGKFTKRFEGFTGKPSTDTLSENSAVIKFYLTALIKT